MTITAVFGVDDQTDAAIDCQEHADGIAIVGAGPTLAATLVVGEQGDVAAIDALTINPVFATLPIVESADNAAIRAIAPTSIIGHGKRFHVKPHDPKSVVIPSS